jgi:hypothetical protein
MKKRNAIVASPEALSGHQLLPAGVIDGRRDFS